MSNDRTPVHEPEEADLLMPWHATGRLSPAEADRMARAIANDPHLVHRLSLAEEERDEARSLAESLPVPSGRARDAVFSKIAALDRGRATRFAGTSAPGGLVERVQTFLASLTPRSFAMGAGFAALLVVLQAGAITGLLVAPQTSGTTYGTASKDDPQALTGTFALVAFVPDASVAQITALLTERGASIVEGPRPGGLFRVRLSPQVLSAADRDQALAGLRARSDMVRFVAPSG